MRNHNTGVTIPDILRNAYADKKVVFATIKKLYVTYLLTLAQILEYFFGLSDDWQFPFKLKLSAYGVVATLLIALVEYFLRYRLINMQLYEEKNKKRIEEVAAITGKKIEAK